MRLILALFIVLLTSKALMAETVWEYVDKKMEQRKKARWSLSSWLLMKERFALQDQWLALNTKEEDYPFEMFIDYAKGEWVTEDVREANDKSLFYSGRIYYSIFGLGMARMDSFQTTIERDQFLSLRLIGSSHQSTHLIVNYGKRDHEHDSFGEFSMPFYQAELSLYLLPFLGVSGAHLKTQKTQNDLNTNSLETIQNSWQVFIDVSQLRLFFESREMIHQYDAVKTQEKLKFLGLRLYL